MGQNKTEEKMDLKKISSLHGGKTIKKGGKSRATTGLNRSKFRKRASISATAPLKTLGGSGKGGVLRVRSTWSSRMSLRGKKRKGRNIGP